MNYSELLSEASKILRTSSIEVERIIITAPYRYKHYKIPKRNGGARDIHHPSPALKALQRWIAAEILKDIPVHESVFSYRKGVNIAMHAQMHVHSNYIVRFDFSNFFPSITGSVVRKAITDEVSRGRLNLDARSIDAVVRLVCCSRKDSPGLALSIGAPSSPHISNALLYSFDNKIASMVERSAGVYTRYADDIYISARTRDVINQLKNLFIDLVGSDLPYLRINPSKVRDLSRKRRMSVTGLNITPVRTLSVGRDLKRKIRTQVYLAIEGKLPATDFSYLRGMLAYMGSVEPAFIDSLHKKFGYPQVKALLDPKIAAPILRKTG